MEKVIQYETKITLENIPVQWIPKFELYYPDLPGFPIVYVHFVKNGTRVFGFPCESSTVLKDNGICDINLIFLSNVKIENDDELLATTKKELEERFGISNKISLNDLIEGCNGDSDYEELFTELWDRSSKVFGKFMPFGRFYEKIYSIVRFVAAWTPKTGRQSEMRMLYNFLSLCGEKTPVTEKWNFTHFFIIPTYQDLLDRNFEDFPKFKDLFTVLEKVWKSDFTKTITVDEVTIRGMPSKWPDKKQDFIDKVSTPMLESTDPEIKIDLKEKFILEQLVDVFNRNGVRTAFFVWSIMNALENNYENWSKEYFVKFYVNAAKRAVGSSQKVVACFVQQGFGKSEFIPIDTWVESFQKGPIGIFDQKEFLNKFSQLGKMERIIWSLAQAKKTNISAFMNILWCIRYGDTGNNEIRGANPLSCYNCDIRNKCPGFKNINQNKILMVDESDVNVKDILTGAKNTFKGREIEAGEITTRADEAGCSFICIKEQRIPKKIFAVRGSRPRRWKLIDEFSGYRLHDQVVDEGTWETTVNELLSEKLPEFQGADEDIEIVGE